MMFWDTVGMSHHGVILIEAPHTIHFIVDAAGDVLNVLHMGSKTQKRTHDFKGSFHVKSANLFLQYFLLKTLWFGQI